MHESYEKRLGHPADFRIQYLFYTPDEGGRTNTPCQGIRSDFEFEQPYSTTGNLFMIWPEFEDANGNLLLSTTANVPEQGAARMWIINPEKRIIHASQIKVGLKGYFREGAKRTAECTVIEIMGLLTNNSINPTNK